MGTLTKPTVRNIIESAYRKIGRLADGETLSIGRYQTGLDNLNHLIKLFQTDGMPLWAMKEYSIPMSLFAGVGTVVQIGENKTINTPYPLKVTQAIFFDTVTGFNVPANLLTRYDFNNLTNSAAPGLPVNVVYEPYNGYGEFQVWPTPDAYTLANRQLVITYQRPFEDLGPTYFDPASGDLYLDFPTYWNLALIYGLAQLLAPEYGLALPDREKIKAEAEEYHNRALSFETEQGSFLYRPNTQGG